MLIWAGDQSWIEPNGHLRSTIMTLDDLQACLIRKNAQASRAGAVHRGLLAGHPLARAPPRPNQRRRKTQPTLAQKSGRYRQGEKTPLPCQKLLDYGQGRLARGINDLCMEADIMTDYQSLGYDKILVTLDGTETQRRVLERAIIVAANNHSELYIGHVIDSTALEAAGTYPAELIADLERAFRDSIADDVAKVQEEGVVKSVEVIVKAGRIRETLTDEMIDVINPDLIVCGARGLSTIKYALLGSISAFLTRNASCDTLVIK